MTDHTRGPRRGDVVEVRLTGTVVGSGPDAPEGTVCVMLRHPRDGSQLIDLYFPADEVAILTRAN